MAADRPEQTVSQRGLAQPRGQPSPLWAAGLVLTVVAVAHAQVQQPKAKVRGIVGASGAHTPGNIPVAVEFQLPTGFHAQSSTAHDLKLVPTRLVVRPPGRVAVESVIYPWSVDLIQAGVSEPLSVFEEHFFVGVRLNVLSGARPGVLTVPAHLTYQVCDRAMCFPPRTNTISWSIRIVPNSERIRLLFKDLFERLRLAR